MLHHYSAIASTTLSLLAPSQKPEELLLLTFQQSWYHQILDSFPLLAFSSFIFVPLHNVPSAHLLVPLFFVVLVLSVLEIWTRIRFAGCCSSNIKSGGWGIIVLHPLGHLQAFMSTRSVRLPPTDSLRYLKQDIPHLAAGPCLRRVTLCRQCGRFWPAISGGHDNFDIALQRRRVVLTHLGTPSVHTSERCWC